MSKRFTGTDIWGQDWFLDLPDEYKLFWKYILDECDHAGFYKVNVRTFNHVVEKPVSATKAIELFNSDKDRVRVVKPTVWFIEDFIVFQYGCQLNPANRLHNSVLKLLGQLEVKLTSIRGLKDLNVGLKDKDKDKDKDSITIKDTPPAARTIKHLSITSDELEKLSLVGYSDEQIENIFNSIANYSKIKNYVSLYLTSLKWLKKEYPEVTTPISTDKPAPIYYIDEPLPSRQVKATY